MIQSKKKYFYHFIIFTILSILINIFIIYQSCLGGPESTTWSSPVVEVSKDIINAISPNTINSTNIADFSNVIRKLIGHFSLFLVDGIITTLAFTFLIKKKFPIILISLLIGLIVSILTEVIQIFVPGRSGEALDSLIDFAGFAVGFLIIAFLPINKK